LIFLAPQKASQSFVPRTARNQFKSVFCRDMCVAENTLRGVLCRIVRFQRTTEAQNAANLSQKRGLASFFESARRNTH